MIGWNKQQHDKERHDLLLLMVYIERKYEDHVSFLICRSNFISYQCSRMIAIYVETECRLFI